MRSYSPSKPKKNFHDKNEKQKTPYHYGKMFDNMNDGTMILQQLQLNRQRLQQCLEVCLSLANNITDHDLLLQVCRQIIQLRQDIEDASHDIQSLQEFINNR